MGHYVTEPLDFCMLLSKILILLHMMKMKKKARYVCPRVTGTGALLLNLICQSVRFNIQVNPLENVNADSDSGEIFYFES